jgi:hypothetical protein
LITACDIKDAAKLRTRDGKLPLERADLLRGFQIVVDMPEE